MKILFSGGIRYFVQDLQVKIFVFSFIMLISETVMAEKHKELKAVLHANEKFTKDLYKILAKVPGNLFFSPISIHAILSLASQGSADQTKEHFIKVLNVPDLSVTAKGYKKVIKHLSSIKDVTLLMANKVFVQDGHKLKKAFKLVAVEQFLSEVQLLDFKKKEAAAKSINTWVEEKTKNKIKDLINPGDVNDETRLVLVNAIYFKGKWAKPFDVEHTTTQKFYLNDNDTVDVQMMHTLGKFHFKNDENLDAKVLELPYTNKDISLIIILPNKRNGIAELELKLAETDLTKITENMYKPEVQISLPKFKIEQTIDLEAPLTELGLGNIFNRNANFSGLLDSDEGLYVSKVVQKAFIEVNEEGAEAAAATGLQLEFMCYTYPQEFVADHPFIIALLDSTNENVNNVLFTGRISKPQ